MDKYFIRIRKAVRVHRFTLVQKVSPRSIFLRKRHLLRLILDSATLTNGDKEILFKQHYKSHLGRAGEPNLNLVAARVWGRGTRF